MSSDALKESMTRRVDDQCARIAETARAEAASILETARTQAAAMRESALKATEAEIAQLRERWEQKARAEAARAELALKNDCVEAVLELVSDRVKSTAAGDGFSRILDALLAELMSAAEGEVVVIAPAAHAEHVKSRLSEHGHGNVKVQASATLRDGVALQDPKRTYRISNTLSSRYSLVVQEARKICMISLFESH